MLIRGVTLLYKVLYREAGEIQFHDTEEWLGCEECIEKMRNLLSANPMREFQVVDDHGVVVVSTLAAQKRGTREASGVLGKV